MYESNIKAAYNSRKWEISTCVAVVGIDRATIIYFQYQAELNQQLKDEIARLKNQNPKPKIRPSSLENKTDDKKKRSDKKHPGSKKRSKNVKVQT